MVLSHILKPPYYTDKKVKLGILIYFLIMAVIAFIADGTGDEGDSIHHYLYAKTAWQYKQHFFDHWAKPVYVLIAFPFAQFGLDGVKLMNVLLNCGSLWLVYRIACALNFRWAWAPMVLLASTPMFNHLSLSGLTEPMCAFFITIGIHLLIQKKWIIAIVVLSFLPFVRSEGLLLLGIIFVYLVILSRYQYIPLLFTGHLAYSIAGYFHNKDLFWVFNKMTYATWNSAYGSGEWMHYINNLPVMAGVVLTILFFIGMLYGLILLIRYFRKQTLHTETPELFLVYGTVVFFFVAHTCFWALGIFNSGGILRVIIPVMPLMALINYRGAEYLFAFINNERWKSGLVLCFVAIAFIYPFSGHIHGYRWKRDFCLKADQYAQNELAAWVKQTYPDYANYRWYYETIHLSTVLGIDWFNQEKRRRLLDSFVKNEFQPGDFIVWDDWFGVVEAHITLESLDKDSRLEKLKTFQKINYWGGTRTTVLFRWK